MYQPLFTRFGPGDSIWIFDRELRVHVFDPARHYVRTVRLASAPEAPSPVLADAMVLPDGGFAVITNATSAFQIHDAAGHLVRSIAAPPGDSLAGQRKLTWAPDGTIWTSTVRGPWRLEHWDTSGALLGRLDLRPDWMVDPAATERAIREGRGVTFPLDLPPPPAVEDVWFDQAGRLWSLGRVADRHWRDGIVATDSTGASHIERDRYYDTVIEVRDPVHDSVLATARFDIACGSMAGPGILVHELVTGAGWVRAELMRVILDEKAIHRRQ